MAKGIVEFVSELAASSFRKFGAIVGLIAHTVKVIIDEALVFDEHVKTRARSEEMRGIEL